MKVVFIDMIWSRTSSSSPLNTRSSSGPPQSSAVPRTTEPRFERDDRGSFRGRDHYSADALVTFNTHDLSTYAGWRSFGDLKTKRSLGIDPGESDDARWHALAMLDDVLRQNAIDRNDVFSVLNFLAQTKSRLLAVSLEDVLGVLDQPNIPGTVNEHPNWRRRLPVSIDQMASAVDIAALKSATRERSRAEL